MQAQTLLIKNIRHLITCDAQDRVLENVNLFIQDGVVRYIGTEQPAAAETINAAGMAVYPGLINTHHHLYQQFTRNLPQVQNLELFSWLGALYEIWKNLNADTVYYSTLTGLGELLKNGCTTCADHHYVYPAGSGDLLEAQFAAAGQLGMRMHATRGSMSLGRSAGGLPPDSVVQTEEEILQDCERVVQKYHDAGPYAMRQVALAPCSPFSVSAQLMKDTALLARKLGVRLHTHLAETKDEEAFVQQQQGMRPLAYMESLGWIGPDVWFAHGIHFNEEELRLLAKTGTGVAHCPASNMKLSSGVARVPEMLALGVPVGLAVDGSASNDGSSLMEEMRTGYLLHRLTASAAAPGGYEMLKIATGGSARLLGRADIGALAEGMAADLFMVDENKLELVGATMDVKSMLATVGHRQSVAYTVVNGKVVVKEGRLTGVDEEKLAQQANAQVARLLTANA